MCVDENSGQRPQYIERGVQPAGCKIDLAFQQEMRPQQRLHQLFLVGKEKSTPARPQQAAQIFQKSGIQCFVRRMVGNAQTKRQVADHLIVGMVERGDRIFYEPICPNAGRSCIGSGNFDSRRRNIRAGKAAAGQLCPLQQKSACAAKTIQHIRFPASVACDDAAAGGTLVMATNAEFPPYEYHDGGEIVGIDADIAAAIAEQLGMELKIEDMAFDSIIMAVNSGKADVGIAGMTVTEDRLENVNFSDPYATSSQVIIVTGDSEIGSSDDLSGKKIGVQLGTTGDILADDVEGATVERYNKGFEAVQALSQGKIDAVIIDRQPAQVFVDENEGLKILDEAFAEEEYAIAVAKDNTELLDKVNAALGELKESGKLDEIIGKYISAE